MDCLDRTNVVQSEIAKSVLTQQMREAHILELKEFLDEKEEFYALFRNGLDVDVLWNGNELNVVWADHADAISMGYSGTGALKTDYTR